jgi:Sec-independent protein translocase protein TatA
MPFGIGVSELLIVGAIIVLLFGGRFFKELGTGLGGFIRELRQINKP